MHPINTHYRLADSPTDYKACRDLFADNHGADPTQPLRWPTVIAERDGEVIGFLATLPLEGRIMAGPLELKGGRNMITFLRLIEAYTNVMKTAGVTQFEFFVNAHRLDNFSKEKLGEFEDYGVKFNQTYMGNAFFTKEVV